MPRRKKAQLPTVQIERRGAIDRARRLAGFCGKNPDQMLKARDVLGYLDKSGKGEDPAEIFTIDKNNSIEMVD